MAGATRRIGGAAGKAHGGVGPVHGQAHRRMIEDAIRVVIAALGQQGLRGDRIVLVGGGCLDEVSALSTGADIYCPDASATLEAAALLSSQ